MENPVAWIGLLVSLISVGIALFVGLRTHRFVARQIEEGSSTRKAQILIDLVKSFYASPNTQRVLNGIYSGKLTEAKDLRDGSQRFVLGGGGQNDEDISSHVDIVLANLQIIGQFYFMKILDRASLASWRYEILSVGRNEAIRKYLAYLVNEYVKLSGIKHDHFGYYKQLYLELEYDTEKRESFAMCLATDPEVKQ